MGDPLPLRLNDGNALRLLRDIAADSSNVIFTRHARQRMRERKVSPKQVLDCLKLGIVSEPVALDVHGNWKLTVSHHVAGQQLNVAVAIDVPSRAIIITVF